MALPSTRISEVSRLMLDAGLIVITAFISPFEEERELAKSLVKEENYFLVHVDCSVEKCEERDVKGLYKKARNGEIKNFTGIDSPYEIPDSPSLIVDTEQENVEQSVDKIYNAIKNKIKKQAPTRKIMNWFFDFLLSSAPYVYYEIAFCFYRLILFSAFYFYQI